MNQTPAMREATRAGALLDGRYRLEEMLGGGGAAAVWAARVVEDDSRVALKLMHPKLRVVGRARERMEREARVLLGFKHPNIARALGVNLDNDPPFIVLELIEGITLEEEIGTRAALSRHWKVEDFLATFTELTAAVHHAHQVGVVHRDLKPSNVMLDSNEQRLKILDFGIAKLLDESKDGFNTTRGRILGSSYYMAPEQALGQAIDERSDVFAMAVIAFEMLTLRRAWLKDHEGNPAIAFAEAARLNEYNHPARVLDRLIREPRLRLGEITSVYPPEVDDVLQQGLHVDREQRLKTPLQLLEALSSAMGSKSVDPHRASGVGWVVPTLERRVISPDPAFEPTPDGDATRIVSEPAFWRDDDGFEREPMSEESFEGATIGGGRHSAQTHLPEPSSFSDATVKGVPPADPSKTLPSIKLQQSDPLAMAFRPREQPSSNPRPSVRPSPNTDFDSPVGPTKEMAPKASNSLAWVLGVGLVVVSAALGAVVTYGLVSSDARRPARTEATTLQQALSELEAAPDDPTLRSRLMHLLRRRALTSNDAEVQTRVLQLSLQGATLDEFREVTLFVSER